jgi:hypothetical protein
MPPKRRPAPANVTRPQPSRASKYKARKVIESATTKRKSAPPKKRAPHGRRTSPSSVSSTSSSDSGDSVSSWQGLFSPPASRRPLQQLPAKETISEMIRGAVETILAEKVPMCEAPFGGGLGTASQTGMAPYPLLAILATGLPHHILLRWPWVKVDTVNLTQLGNFDIDTLPKLHQLDQLRNAYVKKSVKGILQPSDGGPAEVFIGNTNLQASFKDPTSFLAWQIYVSIRTTFHPDCAASLTFWMERLHFFISLNYPWTGILEYIIAFYKLNQKSAPDVWFDSNPTLISYYLALHQQQRVLAVPSGQNLGSTSGDKKAKSASTRTSGKPASAPRDEMCIMFNHQVGCTWPQRHGGEKCPRHQTCSVCTSDEHNSTSCPK